MSFSKRERKVAYSIFDEDPHSDYGPQLDHNQRILVISFHHSAEWYHSTARRILGEDLRVKGRSSRVDVLALYPGNLEASVFLRKVERAIEAGLKGERFTSVLLDGVHNALMSFPRIAAEPFVWSHLIDLAIDGGRSLLSTYSAMAVDLSTARGNLTLGSTGPTAAIIEGILLSRSNTTILFAEQEGRVGISIPDTTLLRQARDITFLWSSRRGRFHVRPPVLTRSEQKH